jgi:K+-transporting ATPase ATPase C chain
VERVAKARHLPAETVRDLVLRHVQGRQFGLLGEERVNVLLLNMDLDRLGR